MSRPGIVIVTYNSQEVIGPCLAAAVRTDADVVVVDNGSQDGTVEQIGRWPTVEVIENHANVGFAAAVNQGVRALDTECVLLLNPDAVLELGLGEMTGTLQGSDVAAVGGKLIDEQGAPQVGFSIRRFPTVAALSFEALGWNRIWPGNPVNRRYRCLDLDPNEAAEVEQPAGAFLMVRRDCWQELGGMDEGFFPLWFEDVDFLLRAHQRGYRVRYLPSAIAKHRGGHSIDSLSAGCRQLYWYGSLLKYASKHFGPLGRRVVCVSVVFGSLLRMIVSLVLGRSPNPLLVYGRVVGLAVDFLFTGRVRGTRRFVATGTTN